MQKNLPGKFYSINPRLIIHNAELNSFDNSTRSTILASEAKDAFLPWSAHSTPGHMPSALSKTSKTLMILNMKTCTELP